MRLGPEEEQCPILGAKPILGSFQGDNTRRARKNAKVHTGSGLAPLVREDDCPTPIERPLVNPNERRQALCHCDNKRKVLKGLKMERGSG